MSKKTQWDLGEPIATVKHNDLPVRSSCIASTALKVVFSVLTVAQPALPSGVVVEYSSSPNVVLEVVVLERQDSPLGPSMTRWSQDLVDSTHGMSVTRLADLFPKLFQPDPEEQVDFEEFFLS